MVSATESSRKVLIVDPDTSTRREIRSACAQDGYQVLLAPSAAEGFQLLAIHRVQVIVCDQGMSHMTGTEFLGRVKELHPDTLCILLTGSLLLA